MFSNIPQNERNTISVANLNMRTTSSVEAMNSVIQRSFRTNPHIYQFIENLRLHESIKSTDLYQLTLGSITNPKLISKRAEDRKRDDKIRICSEKLQNGDISVAEFLKLMANQNSLLGGAYYIFAYWRTSFRKLITFFSIVHTAKNTLNKVSEKSKTAMKKKKKKKDVIKIALPVFPSTR